MTAQGPGWRLEQHVGTIMQTIVIGLLVWSLKTNVDLITQMGVVQSEVRNLQATVAQGANDRYRGSDAAAITFPAPTANWGTVTHFGIYDAASGGNLLIWSALTTSKTINNGDAAPSFAAGALSFQSDN